MTRPLKVLFISSGNSKFGINPIIKTQGESLKRNGINLDYFAIQGKGIKGYLKNIVKLRKVLNQYQYNIIHVHYALSAFCASLTFVRTPLIVSLMGSDINLGYLNNTFIRMFSYLKWKATIVKSEKMKQKIRIKNAKVIPNGIDFQQFKPLSKMEAKKKVNFNNNKYILFIADPLRPEKNYGLAKAAVDLLDNPIIELKIISGQDPSKMVFYYNAADLLLLTSIWEGSPNVIKEAMACNLPIVSTDVGDVKSVIKNTKGCFVCDYSSFDVTQKIKLALEFGMRTNGRGNIRHLEINEIAKKIILLYQDILMC